VEDLTPEWMRMVSEVLDFAKRQVSVKDFRNYSLIAESDNGMSYYDRLRVADFLVESKVVSITDDHLEIVSNDVPDFLEDILIKGDGRAWTLIDSFNFDETKIIKFEQQLLTKIGLNGEHFFIEYLKSLLPSGCHSEIKHISLTDDTKGFDIVAPNLSNQKILDFWEVKTSVRPGNRFRFYLSRNEFEKSQVVSGWKLVAIHQSLEGLQAIGYLSGESLRSLVPKDNHPNSRWQTVAISLDSQSFLEFFV
jgi:hypothetical protein